MRRVEKIDLGDGVFVKVKELTVGEIRAWLAAKVGALDVVDTLLFEDAALSDLVVMSDLTAEAIDNLAPSDIAIVLAKAKELNDRFFAMRARLVGIGQAMIGPMTTGAPSDLPATSPA